MLWDLAIVVNKTHKASHLIFLHLIYHYISSDFDPFYLIGTWWYIYDVGGQEFGEISLVLVKYLSGTLTSLTSRIWTKSFSRTLPFASSSAFWYKFDQAITLCWTRNGIKFLRDQKHYCSRLHVTLSPLSRKSVQHLGKPSFSQKPEQMHIKQDWPWPLTMTIKIKYWTIEYWPMIIDHRRNWPLTMTKINRRPWPNRNSHPTPPLTLILPYPGFLSMPFLPALMRLPSSQTSCCQPARRLWMNRVCQDPFAHAVLVTGADKQLLGTWI